MDASDWIALGAFGVSLASFVVAGIAIVYSRRAAQAARDSADEDRRLREIEADRRVDEKEHRHESLAPDLPGEIQGALRPRTGGDGAMYGAVEVNRAYRVRAFGRAGMSLEEITLPTVTPVNEPMEFMIERWAPGRREPAVKEVVFKFWPPVEGADETSAWSCGCGRPTGETMDGPGHWEHRVLVSYYRIEDSIG